MPAVYDNIILVIWLKWRKPIGQLIWNWGFRLWLRMARHRISTETNTYRHRHKPTIPNQKPKNAMNEEKLESISYTSTRIVLFIYLYTHNGSISFQIVENIVCLFFNSHSARRHGDYGHGDNEMAVDDIQLLE